jgi:hypothetical protein
MTPSIHPAAPHHLPGFIVAPGDTDVFMIGVGIFLLVAVLLAGNFFLFEVVAVLGLLALFTHVHLFWVAALLLAFIDLPEFGKPLDRMAGSLEKIAGTASGQRPEDIAAAEAPEDQHIKVPVKETIVHMPVDAGAGLPDRPAASARS